LLMSNATNGTTALPDQSVALIVNIIQAGIFVTLGPFVCVLGPTIIHIVTFIRSLFAMNYMLFIGSVSAVNQMTALSVFTDQLAVLLVGTLSMTIASLRAARLRAYTSGAVLGIMLAGPLVALVRNQLYFGPVGCTGYGEKTPLFPDGEYIGCDHGSTAFQLTYQGTKVLTVIIVVLMALIGERTMGFSIAMMGSTMIISGGLGLIEAIFRQVAADQELLRTITATFTACEFPITYGIAGGGYFLQWMILKPKRDNTFPDPYLLDPTIDTEKDVKMKTDLAASMPYEQTGVLSFFKAVVKKEILQFKIKKSWWKNYRNAKELSLLGQGSTPGMKFWRPPKMVPMDPETDPCMKVFPFKMFACLVGGKWDDRLAFADQILGKILVPDPMADPKEVQTIMKAVVKQWLGLTKKAKDTKADLQGTAAAAVVPSVQTV